MVRNHHVFIRDTLRRQTFAMQTHQNETVKEFKHRVAALLQLA